MFQGDVVINSKTGQYWIKYIIEYFYVWRGNRLFAYLLFSRKTFISPPNFNSHFCIMRTLERLTVIMQEYFMKNKYSGAPEMPFGRPNFPPVAFAITWLLRQELMTVTSGKHISVVLLSAYIRLISNENANPP